MENLSSYLVMEHPMRPSECTDVTGAHNGLSIELVGNSPNLTNDWSVICTIEQKIRSRHSMKEVNEWKDALKQVSSLSGWSLEETSGYQGKLVKQIVMDLLKTLDIMCLDIAKHPVGLEQRKNKEIKLLKVDPLADGSVLTVGIYGMGGQARPLFQKQFLMIFIPDLQRQILKNLTKESIEVDSIDHGKSQMRSRLGSKRALVILDDVDDHKQLDTLGEVIGLEEEVE
eukprot:Gb_29200 [translate_table: standard]